MANSYIEHQDAVVRINDGGLTALLAWVDHCRTAEANHASETLSEWLKVAYSSPPGLIDFELEPLAADVRLMKDILLTLEKAIERLPGVHAKVSKATLQSKVPESEFVFIDVESDYLRSIGSKFLKFLREVESAHGREVN
ncbi:MAG: hypothetical protein WD045_03350 [Pirellulaceae bacterium]